ncbi:U2 snRNP-associated SURP motif-containing protein [Schistocerca gregaria]|uniref:U2 snRNP-associated SURP motif-containing protein n=1 Tax=Schistocerca gregaria TaxID=7010 RepID=UPI00211E592D|nr:U2 snRNP-associated SURP motif-containing protein [Schistocerca gregaria]
MADKSIMKQIAEQKLKAFSIGSMGKRQLSKKELEEQRKKEQEVAAAQAFEEFVATFQEAPKSGKVWVKAGTYDAGRRQEDTREKGKLYKPQSRLSEQAEKSSTAERAQEYARLLGDRKPDRPGKKRDREKKKSNLELFKEELKLIQEEREERHKYKGVIKSTFEDVQSTKAAPDDAKYGSYDNGDPTTTNLYLGNLNPKITEKQLMEVFGRYGPLASIKIMWPRSDEEKARGRNCGFVAFMNRKDGERALKCLNGKDVMSYEMKLGWGKAVPIPPHPIYIPPAMLELTMPPPPSGLPFNAQPHKKDRHKVLHLLRPNEPYPTEPEQKAELDKILSQAVVKVVIPTERNLLMLIHRMIEFVIREGPMFEAMIMNREINNSMFRFLFENQSPAHVYYRWKLFSMLQGDLQLSWRTQEFRMFKGGSIWRPPPMNPYTQGMPDELVEGEEKEPRKGSLSNTQRDRLEDLLRNMTPERMKVAEAMVFCIEHSEAAEEICDCIAESLSILQTPIPKKIARLYLISDILHNCGVKITNASYYRKGLESRLLQIFQDVHAAYVNLDSRLKAEGFKVRVMQMFRAWEEWAVYPKDFLIRLQNVFLGISNTSERGESDMDDDMDNAREADIDGQPMSGGEGEVEDLDGVPLDGAALLKAMKHRPPPIEEDIDGVPMDDDIDGQPMEEDIGQFDTHPSINSMKQDKPNMPAGFVPSRWETVDPEQVEAQAMTTSKWDMLEQTEPPEHQEISEDQGESPGGGDDSQEGDYSNYESRDLNEERRARLREIELKAVQYQDELECGQRSLKSGWTIQQQVEHYRRKLLRKAEKGEKERQTERDEREADKDVQEVPVERERERQTSSDRRRRENRSERSNRRSSSPDENYYHRETSSSRSKSKRSRSSSDSPVATKRYRSRSRSPASSSRKSSRRSRSPHSVTSKKSRPASPPSPSSSRTKHRVPSPPSPPRSSKRRASSPSTPPRKRRGSGSPVSSHRATSPSSPPRKHKHKHKY